MNILTTVTASYTSTFASFVSQFMAWGEMIFASLLVVNFTWLCLWYAFDKESIPKALSAFLKQAFVVMLFYTLMTRPDWLVSILKTSAYMGNQLTGIPIDPSSIIANGIVIANKVLLPIHSSSLLTMGLGGIVIFVAYLVIMFSFTVVALDLAVTLITSSALVAISPLFLSFSALNATTTIARQALDVILGNAVKLLGIYLCVGAGSKTIVYIANSIPTEVVSFDPYCWIGAASLLFWQISKHLPTQLARIVSGAIHEHHGSEMAAASMAAIRTAPIAMRTLKLASVGAGGAVTMAANIVKSTGSKVMSSSFGSSGSKPVSKPIQLSSKK